MREGSRRQERRHSQGTRSPRGDAQRRAATGRGADARRKTARRAADAAAASARRRRGGRAGAGERPRDAAVAMHVGRQGATTPDWRRAGRAKRSRARRRPRMQEVPQAPSQAPPRAPRWEGRRGGGGLRVRGEGGEGAGIGSGGRAPRGPAAPAPAQVRGKLAAAWCAHSAAGVRAPGKEKQLLVRRSANQERPQGSKSRAALLAHGPLRAAIRALARCRDDALCMA